MSQFSIQWLMIVTGKFACLMAIVAIIARGHPGATIVPGTIYIGLVVYGLIYAARPKH